MAARGLIARWRDRRPVERRALVEAAILLAGASLVVKLSPFRLVARIAGMPVRHGPTPDAAATVATVAWAVGAVARRARFRAVCIEQGLAAQVMLRRRGLASTLHYGVANGAESGLTAHVWVRCEGLDVVGCDQAGGFRLLATFPTSAKVQQQQG